MKHKNTKQHLIHVAPLTALASTVRNGGVFSYISIRDISAGSLVEVPLGKRVLQGIVIPQHTNSATHPREPKTQEYKSVLRVLVPTLLAPQELELAEWIAREYLTPIGIVLKLFLPPRQPKTSRKTKPSLSSKSPETLNTITLTPPQKKALQTIRASKKSILLTGPPSSGKTEVTIEAIRDILQQRKQVLFLFPEISLTPHAVSRIHQRIGTNRVFLYNSTVSCANQQKIFDTARSQKPCVVIGSRSAMFLPYRNLGLVIVDEEHDSSHKSALKSPRYDARAVAKMLALVHRARFVVTSAMPSAEAWHDTQKNNSSLVSLPPLSPKSTHIQIVDMRLLDWKARQKNTQAPLFSQELVSAVRGALARQEQILLLVSRQGMNGFSLCAKCKSIFRCPKCDRALVAQRSGHFLCLGGHFRTKTFPACPTCGHLSFVGFRAGTERVEEAIQRLFPRARVARMDTQTLKKVSTRNALYTHMIHQKIDILVGTQAIAKGWDIPRLTLVGVVDSDSFFSFGDFGNDLRVAQLFFQARGRLGRKNSVSAGTFIAQTYHADRAVFDALQKNDYTSLLETECETRKSLRYPPFCRILTVVGRGQDDTQLRAEMLAIYKNLASLSKNDIAVSRPIKSQKHQKPGWFRRYIVIKYPNTSLPQEIATHLENLPKNWYVDNDAVSFT